MMPSLTHLNKTVNSGGPNSPLTLLSLYFYNYTFIFFQRNIVMINDTPYTLAVIHWINSKNLNNTDRWITISLFIYTNGKSKIINDDQFNVHCGLQLQNVRRQLRSLQNKNILKIEFDEYDNRIITLLVPKRIKNKADSTIESEKSSLSQLPKETSLTFYGKAIDRITTKYKGKNIVEVRLTNVHTYDGNVRFKEYWVEAQYLTKAKAKAKAKKGEHIFKGVLKEVSNRTIIHPVRSYT